MKDRAQAMVMASFVADSHALGVHWIYSTQKIAREYGRVEHLLKPSQKSYHPTKDVGEFTHYGDQTLVLLESLDEAGGFDVEVFSRRWQELFKDYHGYMDQATKGTRINLAKGKSPLDAGSDSNDIAGASRIAPLVYSLNADLDALVKAARTQTMMTHGDVHTVDAAEFFARLCWDVLRGRTPVEAITDIGENHVSSAKIRGWVESGLNSRESDSIETIVGFGQSCHTPEAFPGIIHLISRWENNLEEALIQSVMAGGDSAARGMLVGMVLGAHLGKDAIPREWIGGIKQAGRIQNLLDAIW